MINFTIEQLALNIANARRKMKPEMTQGDMAEKMSVSRKTYNEWEQAKRVPDALQMWQLSQITQQPISYFYGVTETVQPDLQAQIDAIRNELKELRAEQKK